MKIKNILLFAAILTSLNLISQQKLSNSMFYSRFEGEIGDNIKVTANLIRLFDKVSGNYQYRFIDEDNEELHYGKTINVNGNIKDSEVNLTELGMDSYTFTGNINGQSFTGSWLTPDNSKIGFNMTNYYPNGSLPFNVFYLHSEDNLFAKNAKSPTAEIELTLIYPENKYFEAGIVDSVKNIISHSFFGTKYNESNPDSMLTYYEKNYFTTYKDQNTDWYDNGASFSWQKMVSMSIIYNSNYILCVEYLKYAYSGGAHGMTNLSYDIINLQDGTTINYDDVFKEGSKDSLIALLTQKLRADYSIPKDVLLSKAGFFVEEIEPNQNIYINGNGIGFLYNSYEIAPYSQGQTNIFLDFNKIKGLLKKGTPVAMMGNR